MTAPARRPARRPARPQPRDSKAEQPVEIRITVDGTPYTFSMDDASSEDASALRRATGMSLRGLFEAAADDLDIDIVAALVWLVRRRDERGLRYEQVAREIGYDTPMEFDEPEQDRKPAEAGKIRAVDADGDGGLDPTSQAS
ncbi:MAG TPA: hypothetical protein VIV12_14285 [Streptosporangiaceae bacterium]